MCGIAGILHFDGQPVGSDDLSRMLADLEHRGRDGCGVALGSGGPLSATANVALGHRRLSIIDLSAAAAQPMANADGTLWISLNGEIYNYIELREELEAAGYQFRTQSDTEVILAAYDRWGEDCLSRFNGMFAFALWDERRRRLLCARDHLGIKPFYYVANDRFVVFASESRALRRYHENALDTDGVSAYLLGLYVPATWSVFRGVRKLLPGHAMTVEPDGRIALRRFWRVARFADGEDSPLTRRALEADLKRAITRQLRSDVPVGALLSGGIDSGMVVALAAEQGATLDTYSVGFEGLGTSELPAAAAIAATYGTKHHEALVSAPESMSLLDTSLVRLSEPIADSAIVPTYLLAGMAAADGVKVLLSGTGGDEIFGGYDRYVGTNPRRRLLTATPEVLRRLAGRLLPASSKLGARLRNTHLDLLFTTGGDFALCSALQQDDRRRGGFLERLAAAIPSPVAANVPLLYRQMAFDMNVYLPDEILLLFDQMAMAHTVEGRVPLIDIEVVEAAYRFPPASHASRRGTKLLFREIAAAYLGAQHVQRRKQGFAGPVRWWVEHHLPLFREVAMATTSIPGMEAMAPELRRLCAGQGRSTAGESQALFILYCLRRWYDSLN